MRMGCIEARDEVGMAGTAGNSNDSTQPGACGVKVARKATRIVRSIQRHIISLQTLPGGCAGGINEVAPSPSRMSVQARFNRRGVTGQMHGFEDESTAAHISHFRGRRSCAASCTYVAALPFIITADELEQKRNRGKVCNSSSHISASSGFVYYLLLAAKPAAPAAAPAPLPCDSECP